MSVKVILPDGSQRREAGILPIRLVVRPSFWRRRLQKKKQGRGVLMPWQPYPAAVIDEIRTLAARGLSQREIARAMQTAIMCCSTVCLLMRKHGIKRAPTKFTPEEIAWLRRHIGKPRTLTLERFEKRFGRKLSRWYWERETRRLKREETGKWIAGSTAYS